MSWKRKRRRQVTEVPLLVERLQKTEQGSTDQTQSGTDRVSYEEANWARLSPTFRATHNRLRQARGLPTIPPPLVDLYVAPKQPVIRPFDPTDKEVVAAITNAKFFDGGGMMMGGGKEGFTINGKQTK
jgi:hypothetical protein